MKLCIILFVFLANLIFPQHLQTPLEKSDYKKLTSYSELYNYVKEIAAANSHINVKIIAKSVEGREIPALLISKSEINKDKSKITVLIFAQQHGNEPSGKEGALLLLEKFAKGELDSLLTKIDLILVPQMNPDGSEKDTRRNGNDADLNRDHLTLLQPETQGLHKLFFDYMPDATMDVHEYDPFSSDWVKYGYLKNFDEQIGTTTNPDVSKEIRDYSNNIYLPFIKKYLNENKFTYHNYILGGPPDVELIRYSTYDINDGRQSFGSFNTFSFIQEGLNNSDNQVDKIKKRCEGQYTGMLGFLKFIYSNSTDIKILVKDERSKLINGRADKKVGIQFDHVKNGEKLKLTLLSLSSKTDSTVTVNDFRPVVKALYDVERPLGYLIPKALTELVDWAHRQNLKIIDFNKTDDIKLEQYSITKIDSINFEGDIVVNPDVEVNNVTNKIDVSNYYFIPTNQLQSNLIVIALEPKSMIGLVTYKSFEHLLRKENNFPVIRVVKN